MSGVADPVAAAIDDARALIDALLAGGWQEAYVAQGDLAVFIAAEGGGPNPMRDHGDVIEAAPPATRTIFAPHVGTVDWLVEPGEPVAVGDVIARLSVLDEDVGVLAVAAGTAGQAHLETGALAEFGTPLLDLLEHG